MGIAPASVRNSLTIARYGFAYRPLGYMLVLLLAACAADPAPAPTPTPTLMPPHQPTAAPGMAPAPTPASVPTATPTPTLPPTPPAPDVMHGYAAVTAGRAHTCLLSRGGAVSCTGTVDDEAPFPAPTVALESISSGPNHACGIGSGGSVVCWGSNDRDPWYGHTTGQADPPDGVFVSVSAGGAHTCGIEAGGAVACRGDDEFGQSSPPDGAFASISAGAAHTCGIRSDGILTCWGNDEFGQSSPPPGDFQSVSSGVVHSCGLRPDGEAVCWGLVWAGEEPGEDGRCFGLCSFSELVSEEEAGSSGVLFQQVHVGLAGSCGVTTGGSIRCDERFPNSPPEGEYVDVSVGGFHACGLRADGAAVCWALETHEEVPGADSLLICLADGDGSTTCPGQPGFEMQAMAQSGRMIPWDFYSHSGTDYGCGYRLDDSLVCWNDDRSLFLDPVPARIEAFAAADDDTACWLLPDHTVACWGSIGAPEGAFRSISLDETVYGVFGCGLRADGSLACWGDDGPDWGHLDAPTGKYKAVSTGYGHGCAIRLNDTLVCWGNDNIETPPEGTFRSIDGSGLLHCGVRTDHSVECWGRDSSSIDLPQFLEGAYQSVSVGNFQLAYLCGVGLDGTLHCQGNHQTGEIPLPSGMFLSISAGGTHACGVRTDGTAACWGTHEEAYDGDTGQLAPPPDEFRSVSVGGRWSGSSEFSCGVRTDGSLMCWGRPSSAALRDLVGK